VVLSVFAGGSSEQTLILRSCIENKVILDEDDRKVVSLIVYSLVFTHSFRFSFHSIPFSLLIDCITLMLPTAREYKASKSGTSVESLSEAEKLAKLVSALSSLLSLSLSLSFFLSFPPPPLSWTDHRGVFSSIFGAFINRSCDSSTNG
jgi:hypothetical protein